MKAFYANIVSMKEQKHTAAHASCNQIKISDLPAHLDHEVSIKGFVQSVRAQGKVGFITLRNITGMVQCVFLGEALIGELKKISTESYVSVT